MSRDNVIRNKIIINRTIFCIFSLSLPLVVMKKKKKKCYVCHSLQCQFGNKWIKIDCFTPLYGHEMSP